MTAGHFVVLVDTTSPVRVTASLNRGVTPTPLSCVQLYLEVPDHLVGQQDIEDMKIWGDVDPNYDPSIQVAEGDSRWMLFIPWVNVVLSAGNGLKTIHATVRDAVGNETTVSATVTLALDSVPTVTMLSTPAKARYGLTAGFDTFECSWRSDQAFTEYVVTTVTNINDEHDASGTVAITGGTNLAGTGTWTAGERITSSFTTTQLLTASPGDGPKIVKAFVKNAKGVWSV